MALSEAELDRPRVVSKPTQGPPRQLGAALDLSETPPHWSRPTLVLGGDAPQWLDAASAAEAAE